MQTTTEQFHTMRGHVADGCQIKAPSGKVFTLASTMRGWVINGPDGLPVSGYLPSAADVEYFVVNGLYSH
jgi:hypothetical protein